ncbi:hypothetical protein K435DRAFT_790174 [Dendrothele bispora CBS 962.96]|uniref:Uncharacterized protein n=1 Tax=Dendrothele bispora (strain CBS 962.96) TaxID=1314807 RepID=A0A4S8MR94_DENBC|nr:hypothetical protein K435DRAFT_790174 [Dendrothele bispora CBS 962.96]
MYSHQPSNEAAKFECTPECKNVKFPYRKTGYDCDMSNSKKGPLSAEPANEAVTSHADQNEISLIKSKVHQQATTLPPHVKSHTGNTLPGTLPHWTMVPQWTSIRAHLQREIGQPGSNGVAGIKKPWVLSCEFWVIGPRGRTIKTP